MITTGRSLRTRTLTQRVTPEAVLARLVDRERPVMARFADHTIVAADPAEVAQGDDVWDALGTTPVRGASAGAVAAAGGWIGLLSYDLAGTIERLPVPPADPGGPPTAAIGRYDTVAIVADDGTCVVTGPDDDAADTLAARIADATAPSAPQAVPAPVVSSSLRSERYMATVEAIRELIRAGDCSQVNLTRRLTAPWNRGPLALAVRLWQAAGPASHAAYVGMPEGTVVSASPERLVQVADGIAIAEPIKGTAAPGEWPRLSASVKDRAEHVMIVDLLRNDLGRVARPGGVGVPRLFTRLSTPYVEHMVSRIRAELRPDVTVADVMRAVFPSGSVTGTPKVRAMEVIHRFEPVSRGPAFGSVIVAGTDGAVESSVTIRTAWVTGDEARYWCGGAVVWDSSARAEHEESLAKAIPFLRAVGAA